MRHGWLVRVAASCLLSAAPIGLAACSTGGEQALRDTDKVTICHATASANNPYVQQQPDVDGVLSGHDGHPDDIIPPFTYIDHDGKRQHYPGKNWDAEGQAVSKDSCGKGKGNNTESEQAQGSATTTPESGDALTTTTGGGAIAPTTTTGGSGTAPPDSSAVTVSPTSSVPESTTTTVPASPPSPTSPASATTGGSSPAEGPGSPAAVVPTTVGGQNNTATPGQLPAGTSGPQQAAGAQPSPAPAQTAQPAQAPASSTPGVEGAATAASSTAPALAHTGFPTGWATVLGMVLLSGGVGLLVVARRVGTGLARPVPTSHADRCEPA